ncbi:MAG: zinc-dependent metalloprotease [Edaphocola sp.]
MRKIMFAISCALISLCGNNVALGQSKPIYREVLRRSSVRDAAQIALFTADTRTDAAIDASIKNVVYLKLNTAALAALAAASPEACNISVPVNGKNLTLNIYPFDILADGYELLANGGTATQKLQRPDWKFFRGIVNQNQKSLVALTIADNAIGGIFSTGEDGNFNLVPDKANPGPNNENYLLFKEKDIVNGQKSACGLTEDMAQLAANNKHLTAEKGTYSTCKKLRVSMRGDYRLYQKSSYSASNAASYMATLFNGIATLYANENLNVVMSETVINTTQDGYTYGSSSELLYKFGENMQSQTVNGDIAQLVSGYYHPTYQYPSLGGLAWLDVLCFTPAQYTYDGQTVWVGPYSIVDNYIVATIPQVPLYSWDVEAATHEMGHSIGSPHTQSCTWPGGAIDGCYPVEGSCTLGPIPTNGGTIMSYCHLQQNIGINFANGFGPLPGDLIRSQMAAASCLSTFSPSNSLDSAQTTRIANSQCSSGDWTYYFYDNNTESETDDELLLMVNTNGQDIGNVDSAGFEIKTITTSAYGSGLGTATAAPYAIADWKEINKRWVVSLPATLQPTAAISVRLPFTTNDFTDLQGSASNTLQSKTDLEVLTYNTQSAADTPTAATTAQVTYMDNGNTASTSQWTLDSAGNYFYAEYVTQSGLFGATIGHQKAETGISSGTSLNDGTLLAYPNPVGNTLNISLLQPLKKDATISIYDKLGRRVFTKTIGSGTKSVTLPVGSLSQGVYSICLSNVEENSRVLFIKN